MAQQRLKDEKCLKFLLHIKRDSKIEKQSPFIMITPLGKSLSTLS